MEKSEWVKISIRTAHGKKTGVVLANKQTGVERTLLNGHGKYQKYNYELKTNKRVTNSGQPKLNKQGNQLSLSRSQRAFRAGYKSAVIDRTKAYNAKKK